MSLLPPRYANLRPLGTGSFASVYAADDTQLGRAVAVKVLRDEHLADASVRTRFAREIRTGALLGSHPFVVTLHDAGEWSGHPFLVLELLSGSVAERREPPPALARRWLTQAAEALDFAHLHGIVHRDVKPSNLLLDASGEVRLADFGVARDPDASELTLAGYVVGTPGYLAPEVAAGEAATPAADIYSLAVVARELLGDRPELARGLARDPRKRPASARALVRDLGAAEPRTRILRARSRRVAPIPVTQAAPVARRPSRRHRSFRIGLVVATVAAVAAGSAAGAALVVDRLAKHASPAVAAKHVTALQTCALSSYQHDANVVIRGLRADAFCRSQAHVLRLEGDRWTYRAGGELIAPDHGVDALGIVCRVHRRGLAATVYDSGAQRIGADVCSWYSSGGWRV